jgi:hypothetical protein
MDKAQIADFIERIVDDMMDPSREERYRRRRGVSDLQTLVVELRIQADEEERQARSSSASRSDVGSSQHLASQLAEGDKSKPVEQPIAKGKPDGQSDTKPGRTTSDPDHRPGPTQSRPRDEQRREAPAQRPR